MSVLGRLHLITDTRPGRKTLEVVHATLRAGVAFGTAPTIQVRVEDAMTDREAYQLATAVMQLCREVWPATVAAETSQESTSGAAESSTDADSTHHDPRQRPLCLVNDRLHVALAVGADGGHVGADDLPVAAARRVLGGDAVLGATAREPMTAKQAVAEGASYLGVGPAYRTTTKTGLPDPLGPSGVAAVAAAVDIPVIAIGGVTVDAVPALLDAGAYGVAVVGGINDAADPYEAASRFFQTLRGRR
jgi:thiamine-phosphate pyrophosphorylase